MARDRTAIGLTPESIRVSERLVTELRWFAEGQDLGRLALAYAIENQVGEGAASNTETRWTESLFDKTGEIRALIASVYPSCETPVRQMEYLVNEGLRLLGQKLTDSATTPSDLLT